MKKYIILLALLTLTSAQAWSEGWFQNTNVYARLGYSIGGTAPLDMPGSIRKLNSYSPRSNVNAGVELYKPLHNRWGIATGLYIENKGMKTDATVKGYHMEITRGGETLEGLFTGRVSTKVRQWMWTLSEQATYELGSHFRLKFGPYASVITAKAFEGTAYDGYLRKGNPTGDKVLLGTEDGQKGNYDFSDDMRSLQWGVKVGCDYHFSKSWGAFAEISWGVAGIFKRDFHTIEQTMYPIYGSFGLAYKLR